MVDIADTLNPAIREQLIAIANGIDQPVTTLKLPHGGTNKDLPIGDPCAVQNAAIHEYLTRLDNNNE